MGPRPSVLLTDLPNRALAVTSVVKWFVCLEVCKQCQWRTTNSQARRQDRLRVIWGTETSRLLFGPHESLYHQTHKLFINQRRNQGILNAWGWMQWNCFSSSSLTQINERKKHPSWRYRMALKYNWRMTNSWYTQRTAHNFTQSYLVKHDH